MKYKGEYMENNFQRDYLIKAIRQTTKGIFNLKCMIKAYTCIINRERPKLFDTYYSPVELWLTRDRLHRAERELIERKVYLKSLHKSLSKIDIK